jgi:hypothetical protein
MYRLTVILVFCSIIQFFSMLNRNRHSYTDIIVFAGRNETDSQATFGELDAYVA